MSKYINLDRVKEVFDYAENEFCECDYAVKNIREAVENLPAEEVIPLGVELWSDRFEIKRRGWRSVDGEHMAESFMIVRKEDNK